MNVLAIGETSKSDDKGTVEVSLKVLVNGRIQALELAALSGKQVDVRRQSGELIDVGVVKTTEQKKRTKETDEEIDGMAKIVGSRAFQKIVGLLVMIEASEVQPSASQPRLDLARKRRKEAAAGDEG